MYQEKLVLAVKHNGRVLREQGDTVLIPFGSEYTLHFKNLNSLRALVRVEVDGTDATEGTSLIVPANGTIDLERFIRNGNLSNGNRFKFIERTGRIENGPRGIKAEDGLIRVEFEFEQQAPKIEYETIKRTYVDEYWRTRPTWYGPYYGSSGQLYSASSGGGVSGSLGSSEMNVSSNASYSDISSTYSDTSGTFAAPNLKKSSPLRGASLGAASAASAQAQNAAYVNQVNDAGITVPGSESDQKFKHGAWFPTDGQKHVMVLRLLGQLGEDLVTKPVTVKTRVDCATCGTSNRWGFKFCRECGTALTQL